MNHLKDSKKVSILSALVEGNSIRSTSRMTGVHKNTIMDFLVRMGNGCERLLDQSMVNLSSDTFQIDEVWCFVGKKQRHLTDKEKMFYPDLGDQYTFVALDAFSKLVPVYEVGKRTSETTLKFISNLYSRLKNRVQITSDAFNAYPDAVDQVFGADVDYAQLVKSFHSNGEQERRYSPPGKQGGNGNFRNMGCGNLANFINNCPCGSIVSLVFTSSLNAL